MTGKKWKKCLQIWCSGCMIIMVMLMTACGLVGDAQPQIADEESALAFLDSLESYEAQVAITFYSNKGENTYMVNQKARVGGQFRLEITEPAGVQGVLTICDGQRTVQTDPSIGAEVEAKPTPVRDALLLYRFLDAYHENSGTCEEGADGNSLVLTASYGVGHKKIVTGKLTLKKGEGTPLTLEITDENGSPAIRMTYQSFQINPELTDDSFNITTETPAS